MQLLRMRGTQTRFAFDSLDILCEKTCWPAPFVHSETNNTHTQTQEKKHV